MTVNDSLAILKQLQDFAIQKGLFQNVEAVNQVSEALAVVNDHIKLRTFPDSNAP